MWTVIMTDSSIGFKMLPCQAENKGCLSILVVLYRSHLPINTLQINVDNMKSTGNHNNLSSMCHRVSCHFIKVLDKLKIPKGPGERRRESFVNLKLGKPNRFPHHPPTPLYFLFSPLIQRIFKYNFSRFFPRFTKKYIPGEYIKLILQLQNLKPHGFRDWEHPINCWYYYTDFPTLFKIYGGGLTRIGVCSAPSSLWRALGFLPFVCHSFRFSARWNQLQMSLSAPSRQIVLETRGKHELRIMYKMKETYILSHLQINSCH